ncbi:nucleotidyltransferase family protein [Sulfolobus sp. S-194]|uniref:nucleotidyltransferase family protein n=1 Tax=Sulfolobus sp. S-194 TaxID=2512240 RepID=UPI0014372AC2|nr:nucleotidyltransferase family protein [Sulfolobus sp. S-194]QIW23424.1 nucleotidyltransferase family protein [Sulfolobus sp. S-194]
MRIGAIVLAAGEAKRFGKNKLIQNFMGKPIIIRVIESVNFLDRVIIVGKYIEELIPLLKNEIVIYNPKWMLGISESIKLGVRFFQDYDGVLIVLGDMPLLTSETIRKIIANFKENCSAIVPVYNNIRGNPVLISRKLYAEVFSLSGDIGAREILKKRNDLCFVECGKEVVTDVDTESDLTSLQQP